MQPFDYRLAVQNPVAMALQGYQQGQQFQNQRVQAERDTQLYDMQMKQFQMQEQALAQEQARARAMQGELGGFAERLAANEATVDDVVSISAKYPELSEQIQASWALKDDAQKEATKKEMVRFGSAIKFSPDDVAVRLVDERIAALRENGNPEDLAAAENIKGYLEMGMPEAALASISLYANNVMKPEEWEAFSNIIMPKRPEAAGEIGQILQNWQNGYYDEFYGPEMAREMAERDLEMAQGGLTEYQRAQLGLDQQRLALDAYELEMRSAGGADREIREDPNGIPRYIDTGEPVFPDVETAPETPKPLIGSEAMARVTAGLPNAKQAVEDLDRLVFRSKGTAVSAEGYDPASDWGAAAIEAIPDFGLLKGAARTVGGEDYQLFKDSYGSFEAAMLPIISGAAITESEGLRQMRALEIKPGDSEQTKTRKIAGMRAMVQGVEMAARGDTSGFLSMLDRAGSISGAGPVKRNAQKTPAPEDEDPEIDSLLQKYGAR